MTTALVSVAPLFKAALFTAAKLLYVAPIQVVYGHPGTDQENDIVSFGRVSSVQDFATMTPNRTREELLTCDVVFSCYRGGGGITAEQVAAEQTYALLGQLEYYTRFTDTTLGGIVRWCFLTSHDSDGTTQGGSLQGGRTITTTATFTARARISN